MQTMKALVCSWLVVGVSLGTALSAGGQTPVGALAIDERQRRPVRLGSGLRDVASAAQAAALRECGARCSVVLTFARCGAYAADQDADSTAVGWAESFDSAVAARQAALSECGSRGGSGCTVRVWGCNAPVVEEGLGLNQPARRQIQQGLRSAGFDPEGSGRSVRSADAGGDTELAVGARRTVDRVSGWTAGRGVAQPGRLPASGTRRHRGCGFRGTGSRVLAVDPEQHEPRGVRGISEAVSEWRVPGAGAESPGGDGGASAWSQTGTGSAIGGGSAASATRNSGVAAAAVGSAAGDAHRPPRAVFRPKHDDAPDSRLESACWMEISQQPWLLRLEPASHRRMRP